MLWKSVLQLLFRNVAVWSSYANQSCYSNKLHEVSVQQPPFIEKPESLLSGRFKNLCRCFSCLMKKIDWMYYKKTYFNSQVLFLDYVWMRADDAYCLPSRRIYTLQDLSVSFLTVKGFLSIDSIVFRELFFKPWRLFQTSHLNQPTDESKSANVKTVWAKKKNDTVMIIQDWIMSVKTEVMRMQWFAGWMDGSTWWWSRSGLTSLSSYSKVWALSAVRTRLLKSYFGGSHMQITASLDVNFAQRETVLDLRNFVLTVGVKLGECFINAEQMYT